MNSILTSLIFIRPSHSNLRMGQILISSEVKQHAPKKPNFLPLLMDQGKGGKDFYPIIICPHFHYYITIEVWCSSLA
jgi:hypothetical protein